MVIPFLWKKYSIQFIFVAEILSYVSASVFSLQVNLNDKCGLMSNAQTYPSL